MTKRVIQIMKSSYEILFRNHVKKEGGAIKNIKGDKGAETIKNQKTHFEVILEISISSPPICNRLFGYNGIKIK